jgi:hypothetical protein
MASSLELRRLSDVPSFLVAALRIRRQMLAAPGRSAAQAGKTGHRPP